MTKITPEHLTRGAYIYIRQSTADQLLHNHESRRRQYGLADRAGKTSSSLTTILVVRDPASAGLALSACRRRFAKVGSDQSMPSRCRDWRDWHTLIEFCGLVGTIIVDEEVLSHLRPFVAQRAGLIR